MAATDDDNDGHKVTNLTTYLFTMNEIVYKLHYAAISTNLLDLVVSTMVLFKPGT